MGGVRDWSDLLPELLGCISKLLPPVEYFRFGSVCTSWAAAAGDDDAPNWPQGTPFLLHLGTDGESCTLVNANNGWRPHRIAPLLGMRDKLFVGSQEGWIVILDEYCEVSLLNPLTRARIQLPSVATIPGAEPVYNPDGSIKAFIDNIHGNGLCTLAQFRLTIFKKIVVSPKSTADSYTAVAIFGSCLFLAVATSATGGKWTLLNVGPFMDIIYRDGKFLLLSDNGHLWVLDTTTTPSPKITKIPNTFYESEDYFSEDKFLVDDSGDLLQVWRIQAIDANDLHDLDTEGFEVVKFDPDRAVWVKLKSLGDRALFLGSSYSTCLSVREFPELKPNCVYFTQVLWDWTTPDGHRPQLTRDVGVFNMEDGSFNRYCPSDPRLNWPPPIWFTPSLQ